MKQPDRVVFIDGECNLCHGLVRFLEKNTAEGTFWYSNIQSDYAGKVLRRGPQPGLYTLYYLEQGVVWEKSDAVLRITKHLRFPFRLLTIFRFLPGFLRDLCYDFVARRRYKWFGKRQCEMPQAGNQSRVLK